MKFSNKYTMKKHFLLLFVLACFTAKAQNDFSYKVPPKDISDLVMAPPTPSISVDSKGQWMLLMQRASYPTVEELAQPELRIAGLRLNPANFGPSRSIYYSGLELKNLASGKILPIQGMPQPLQAGNVQWSPLENWIAFTQTNNDRIDLYLIDVASQQCRKINQSPLNMVIAPAFSWIGPSRLMYKTVPEKYRAFPKAPAAPKGPVVQENEGKAAASRTYQDLIRNRYDEELFEYMATSQPVINDLSSERPLLQPAIYKSMNISPDRSQLLLETIDKPFSYLVPMNGFAYSVSVASLNEPVKQTLLVKNPSEEGQPIGFDDAVQFPHRFEWRDDAPATITFVSALDNGMGKSNAPYRDVLYFIESKEGIYDIKHAREALRTERRLRNIIWGNPQMALIYQSMTSDRKQLIHIWDPSSGKMDLLQERSTNDAYNDLGNAVLVKNTFGRQVLSIQRNGQLLFRSQGASPDGDMPLLQRFDPIQKKATIVWRCKAPYYETIVQVLDPENLSFVTSRESNTEVPNYYLYNLNKKTSALALTSFTNPYPLLEGIKKQKISYKRADSIQLTGDLYLPKDHDPATDGPLPVIMWAYPREYKSAADAAQVRGSKYTFTRINYGSPIFWVTQGYAVLDNAEMPIVGEGKKEPNDNFIPQLYLNAHAAIQALARMGVGDSNRVAVGGHSYGAFMTANLLAHTNLFKAGIARSGAYNRTLTPFGFQAEERTYWEAPDVYHAMSPFSYANKIKTPLLLIHGELDNNPGTFPIQSERFYNAVKGHGGNTRLVMLPYESHGYAAKENILHMLWEQNQWLERHVKNNTGKPTEKKGF